MTAAVERSDAGLAAEQRRCASVAALVACALTLAPQARAAADPSTTARCGAPLIPESYPSTGALVEWLKSGSPLLICTGTRVGPRLVLTAAHCVARLQLHLPSFTTARDISRATRDESVRAVRIYVHPKFDPVASRDMHDVALVELESAAPGPVSSIDFANGPSLTADACVELVGYGGSARADVLRATKSARRGRIAAVAADEFVVGGPGESQSCMGDSGGPAFQSRADGSSSIVGVVSRSANDATECTDGTILTRLDAHDDWIAATLHAIRDASVPDRTRRERYGSASRLGSVFTAVAGLFLVVAAVWARTRWGSTGGRTTPDS